MSAIDAGDVRAGLPDTGFRAFFLGRTFAGRPYLISPAADFICAGGAGLIVLAAFMLLIPPKSASGISRDVVVQTALVFSTLAYFVNYPHFMASYELLYGNLERRMGAFSRGNLMWWRYFNAAVIVPVALIGFFLYLVLSRDIETLGMTVHLMFFFVGWHYVKQSYGVFIVLSGMKGVIYTPWQVRLLKLHAYSLWIYSWYKSGSVAYGAAASRTNQFWGVAYKPLPVYKTADIESIVQGLVALAAVLAFGAIAWQWRATRRRPSVTGIIGYTSMYPLFAFAYIHPLFAYSAPMFHSLQYMLFVFAYKRGEWKTEGVQEGLHEYAPTPEETRTRSNFMRALKYFFAIAATGAIGFDVLPFYFQGNGSRWGVAIPGMFLFHLFINTHHYFIDNVIWRRDNKDVGKYLFVK